MADKNTQTPESVIESIGEGPATKDPVTELTPEQAADQREDAVLEKLDPEAEPESNLEVSGEPEEQPEESETPEEESTVSSEELAEAYTVLRRDGFKPEDLKAMDEASLLRLAEHRKKVQSDVDRLLREAREGNSPQQETDSEQTPEESGVAQQQAEATPDQPFRAHLEETAKPLSKYLGLDEEGEKLLLNSYEAIMAPLSAQLEQMNMAMIVRDVEAARTALADKYPQVSDAKGEAMQKVVDRMAKLYTASPEDSQQTTVDLMEEAIVLEFRDELRNEAASAQETIKKYQRNGLPDTPKRQKTPGKELTPDEREDQILALLESDLPDRLERAKELSGR
jgi:hypothetical protein